MVKTQKGAKKEMNLKMNAILLSIYAYSGEF